MPSLGSALGAGGSFVEIVSLMREERENILSTVRSESQNILSTVEQ